MRKFYRIALVAIILGLILFLVGMSKLNWSFIALDQEQLTKKEYIYNGDNSSITSFEVSFGIGEVKLIRGDSFKIIYYDSELSHTTINDTGETITFNQTYNVKNIWSIGFHGFKRAVSICEVYIPSGALIDLNLRTKNGSIEAKNIGELKTLKLGSTNARITLTGASIADSVTLESSNGRLNISDTSAELINLQTTNASINLYNINSNSLNVKTSNGSIDLEKSEVNGDARLETTNNQIELEHVKADAIAVFSTNGEVDLEDIWAQRVEVDSTNKTISAENISATKSIKLKSSNGKIEVSEIESPDISLITTNASISGSITGKKGDFTIDSHTTNSTNNLDNHTSSSGKKLYVRTSNGRINISFESNDAHK